MNQSPIVPMSSCEDLSRKTAGTPLGAIGRGLIAGAAGSLAMDVLWYARYRRGGGKQHFFAWEFSSGLSGWEEAPVPGQVGKHLLEGLFQKKLPPRRAALVSNITHWAYGMLNGAAYAIAAESLGQPRTWHGLPFGAGVWALSYAILPAAGLYKPIRDYDRATLAKDLSAHLLYGTTTAAAERLLSPLTRHPHDGRAPGAATQAPAQTAPAPRRATSTGLPFSTGARAAGNAVLPAAGGERDGRHAAGHGRPRADHPDRPTAEHPVRDHAAKAQSDDRST